MSLLSILAAAARALPIVGKAVGALTDRKKPDLQPPLGESEASRALRLENERRAAEARERALRAKD
jgi:hypothetical protein